MGIDIQRFIEPPNENLICSICLAVFDDPVVLASCDHTFCRSCIDAVISNARNNQRLNADDNEANGGQVNQKCPVCKQIINSRYIKPQRIILNIWKDLKLRCRFQLNGCPEVVTVDRDESHARKCSFNNLILKCPEECGYHGPLFKDGRKIHSCVDYLKGELHNRVIELKAMESKWTREDEKIKKIRCILGPEWNRYPNVIDAVQKMKNDLERMKSNHQMQSGANNPSGLTIEPLPCHKPLIHHHPLGGGGGGVSGGLLPSPSGMAYKRDVINFAAQNIMNNPNFLMNISGPQAAGGVANFSPNSQQQQQQPMFALHQGPPPPPQPQQFMQQQPMFSPVFTIGRYDSRDSSSRSGSGGHGHHNNRNNHHNHHSHHRRGSSGGGGSPRVHHQPSPGGPQQSLFQSPPPNVTISSQPSSSQSASSSQPSPVLNTPQMNYLFGQ